MAPLPLSDTVAFLTHIYAGPHLRVFALRSLFLYSDTPPSRHPSFRLPEPNLFLYKYPSNLIPVILPAFTSYEECSETSAHKIQTPVNHPKERIQWYGLLPCFKTRYSSLPKLYESSPCPSILFLKDIILQCTVNLGLPNGLSSSDFPTKTLRASLLNGCQVSRSSSSLVWSKYEFVILLAEG